MREETQPANEQEEYEVFSATVDMLGKLGHDLPVLMVVWDGIGFETRCHQIHELILSLKPNYKAVNCDIMTDQPSYHVECWKTVGSHAAGLPADLEFDAYFERAEAAE